MSTYETAPCRFCGAPVIWAVTFRGGRMPVDAEPTADGTVLLLDAIGGQVNAIVVSRYELSSARINGGPLRRAHRATCPKAKEWRRKR